MHFIMYYDFIKFMIAFKNSIFQNTSGGILSKNAVGMLLLSFRLHVVDEFMFIGVCLDLSDNEKR